MPIEINQQFLERVIGKVNEGYISVQRHPQFPLSIYNYTQRAQYDWHWTDETTTCRGLILGEGGTVVARPFQKFFSYEQLNGQIPNEPYEVLDKVDGSLGILYWWDDQPYIATRGSFISEQAERATAMLHGRYRNVSFSRALTYLFEIIYPENRIVVDYGNSEELVLLGAIHTATGQECDSRLYAHLDMPKARSHGVSLDILSLQNENLPNSEGYVLRFASNTRVKIKFAEYKRLHKLLTGVNAKHVWESLRDGKGINELIDRVPDEYFKWVQEVAANLQSQFDLIEQIAKDDFRNGGDYSDRKVAAEYFKRCPYPAILFSMLDGKDYAHHIWRIIKPSGERAFRCDIDI